MKKKEKIIGTISTKPRNPFGSLSAIMKKGGSHAKPEKAKRAQRNVETKKAGGTYGGDFEPT